MGQGLSIAIEEVRGRCVLRLEGWVDAVTAPALDREIVQLFDTGRKKLLLNFLKVDYLGSAGIELLLSASQKFKAAQGHFALCSLADRILDVLKAAGFERFLSIYSNEVDGLKGLE